MASSQSSSQRLAVTGVVTFYLVAALAMVMANKWVLSSTDVPLFFLFTQFLIAVVLFLFASALRFLPDKLAFSLDTCKGLVPMVGYGVAGLILSNFTLKYVDASFYQVARGLVLPFTVATSFFALNTRPSFLILVACAVVTLGFFIGVFLDSVPVSALGIFFGVSSSMITAWHSVVIKKSLNVVSGSALLLSWYTNLLSAAVMIPIFLFAGEGPAIARLLFNFEGSLSTEASVAQFRTFVYGSAITGSLGFLMSIASLLSIKVTSPITHMISSAVRGVAASLLGMWLFHDIITTGRATSIAVILLGSFYYTWVKHQESQAAPSGNYEKLEHRQNNPNEPRIILDIMGQMHS
ncbi:hypothetical protein DL96DRAFT_1696115 [Flagelloscypha sp. PMI_526]|nr:hypothetical protein DL96DRAFT_1696115 [Flagelloscypha sp. PMI_526]